MPSMVKDREGYRTLFAQLPEIIWDELAKEAALHYEGNITKALTRLLIERYNISPKKLPKPKRVGRPRRN